MSINIDIPAKELYSVLVDSFEDEEISRHITDFIFLPENIDKLKESLTKSIEKYYKEQD